MNINLPKYQISTETAKAVEQYKTNIGVTLVFTAAAFGMTVLASALTEVYDDGPVEVCSENAPNDE